MVLIEPPSLPDSPTKGCCDWTEVSLSSHVSLPFQKAILNFEAAYFSLALSRSWRMTSVAAEILYQPCDQRITDAVYSVFKFPERNYYSFRLYRGRSRGFDTPEISFF